MKTLIALLFISQLANAEQLYYYPVGKTDSGQTTYQLATLGRDGLYYPTSDTTLYTMSQDNNASSQMWSTLVTANNMWQNNYQQQLQKSNDLYNQELMLNRVLDRQRMLGN